MEKGNHTSSWLKLTFTLVSAWLMFATACPADPLARTNWFDSSGTMTASPGHLAITFTNQEQFWTSYIAPTNTPLTLSQPGNQLRLTWTFTPKDVTTFSTGAPIAISLVYTPDANRLTTDGAPGAAPYGGYASFIGAYAGNIFFDLEGGGRTDSSTASPLFMAGWPEHQGWTIRSGPNYVYSGAPNGRSYTVIMTLIRNAAGGLDVSTVCMGNSNNIISQCSYTDPTPNTFTFNTVCLYGEGGDLTGTIDTTQLQVDFIETSPATIAVQPSPTACYPGQQASFSVVASGASPFSYQWTFNSNNVAGGTNATLILTNVQPGQAGNYAVVVTNVNGSVVSSNALLTVRPPLPCMPPPAGLVSWWPADGNALDIVGGNNGSLLNAVIYENGEQEGNCFLFDGVNSAVQVGNATNLQLQDFTIEAWVKRTSPDTSTAAWPPPGLFFSFGTGGYGFGMNNDGTLRLTQVQVGGDDAVSTASVSDTAWHHVAVTKSSTNVVFFIDGVAGPVLTYTNLFQFSTPACIGAVGDISSSPYAFTFFGAIDELSIYNRPLRNAEIQAIFNSPGGKCQRLPQLSLAPSQSAGNLVVRWPIWASGFNLQSCEDDLTTGNWSNLPIVPQTNTLDLSTTLPPTKTQQFFRLAYPMP